MRNFIYGFMLFNLGFMQTSFALTDTGLSASSLKLKVFKMAVSLSPLCTDLITVLDNGNSPTEVDFLQNPNLGNGTLADGTYPCIVIEFSDVLTFRPSSNSSSGHCSTAVDSTLDICRTTNGGSSVLIDGSTTTCGVPGTSDRVAMYISTAASGNNGDGFSRPTSIGDTAHGNPLGAALTISGTTAGKFVVNPTGQVCDKALAGCDGSGGGGTTCALEAPTFSFSKQ